jgi:hypothetical protein
MGGSLVDIADGGARAGGFEAALGGWRAVELVEEALALGGLLNFGILAGQAALFGARLPAASPIELALPEAR